MPLSATRAYTSFEAGSSLFTITLTPGGVGLASSTTGVGRQSTLIDNTGTRWQMIRVIASIRLGTSPVANRAVYFHRIGTDGTSSVYTDGAGDSDAALTVKNAKIIGAFTTGGAPATGDFLKGEMELWYPGPKWGIAIWHDSGVNLDADAGDHSISWEGFYPDRQT